MGAALLGAAGLGAAGSLLGGVMGNKWNARQAQMDRDFQADQARTARDFEERMSNSAWQRGVADMRLAGINPMLAFMQGGASSPSAGAPGGSTARGQDVISPAVSSAQHGIRMWQDLKNMNEQIRVMSSQATKNLTEAQTSQAQGDVQRAVLAGLGFEGPMSSYIRPITSAKDFPVDFKRRLREYDMMGLELPAMQNAANVAGTKYFGLGASYLQTISKALFGGGSMIPRFGGR